MKTSRGAVLAGVLCAVCGTTGAVHAQGMPVTDGGSPEVGDAPVAKPGLAPFWQLRNVKVPIVPGVALTPVDNNALYQQDEQARAQGLGTGVKRVSIERPVSFDWRAGAWYDVPPASGGGKIYIVDVHSPNAWGVRLHIQDMDLPPGAMMTVYPPEDPESAPAPYEGRGRLSTGDFWARTAFGDTARVEVFVPHEEAAKLDLTRPLFSIDALHHWYINLLTGTPDATPSSEVLGCHRDISCEAWGSEAWGVALLYFNGGLCTGQLITSQAGDWTPYLLTARHCYDTQTTANALETYWFFQTTSCNGTAPSLPTGANRADDGTLLQTGTASDYNLTMIEGTIRRDLWWQGWDANAFGNGNSAFNISHPDGSFKRFASGTTSATGVGCNIASIGPGVTGTWSLGTTEPGSSGSALYDSARRVRGSLSCANGVCAGSSARFYFGPFATTYGDISGFLSAGSDDVIDFFGSGDSCAAATDRGGVGATNFTNLIVKSTDEDWLKFTVPAGGSLTYSLSFTHAWGDIDTQLLDGCGAALASSTSTTNSESVTWTNPTNAAKVVSARVYLFNDTRNQYNFTATVAAAPIQGNDLCANAATIADGATATGTTLGTGTDGASTCGFNVTSDVWFRFTPTCSGVATFDTFGSAFDTVLSVHTDTCPGSAATTLACNDDFGGRQSRIDLAVTAGTTYRIRLAGYNNAAGSYVMNVNLARPSNNACAGAVPVGLGTTPYSNCGATRDGGAESLAGCYTNQDAFAADIWYSYTPTQNETLTVTTAGSSYDTMLAAYAFCPSGAEQAIICNDDSNATLQSTITFAATAGTTYLLRVGGYFGSAGAGQLTLSSVPSSGCDSVDFNNDGVFPDDQDLADFIFVLGGGVCGTCNDVDFNNDGVFPDDSDLETFLFVLGGGSC